MRRGRLSDWQALLVTVAVFMTSGSLLVYGRRSSRMPSLPRAGQHAVLELNGAGARTLWLAGDVRSAVFVEDAVRLGDVVGAREAWLAGDGFAVDSGTGALLLRRVDDRWLWEVRVLDGPHAGRAGVVREDWVKVAGTR